MMVNKNKFVNEPFDNTINDTIKELYPNLGQSDKLLIKKYFTSLVEIIAITMGMTNKTHKGDKDNIETILENSRKMYYEDNNKYLRWLLQYILPYISESNGKTKKDINSFIEIYTEKIENVDINKNPPKYVYSNVQYGRCDRTNKKEIKEISFSEKHIENNYYLLIDTIRECCHKMHVNWKDILPYSYYNYQETQLFIDTKEQIETGKINDWDERELCNPSNFDSNKFETQTKGLYIGTIYDTISNIIYENILPVKWLLYNIITIPQPNVTKNYEHLPLVTILNEFINLEPFGYYDIRIEDKIINRKTYWNGQKDENIKKEFSEKWKIIVDAFTNRERKVPLNYSQSQLQIDFDGFSTLIKSIVLGFNFGYSKIGLISKNYIPLKLKVDYENPLEFDEDDNGNLRSNELKNSLFYKTIKSIKVEDIYNYFCDSFFVYCQSIYFRIGDGVTYINTKGEEDNSSSIVFTAKNFYNYCKSLLHYTSNGFIRLPRYWKSMTNRERQIFRDKLVDKTNLTGWFNIMRYLKSYVKNIKVDSTYQKSIFLYCNKHITQHIFVALIMSGTFTFYKPCLNSENKNVEIFSISNNNPYWIGSYHYLTGLPYNKMNKHKYYGHGDKEIAIFDYYKNTPYKWYTLITMKWISQFGLCHRIIHNRIHYISGGTGIGKSSLVPMLYLYYTKSLKYKLHGNVICTFPRIQPTQETARIISSQLGLPLKDNDNKYIDINYDVQIITQKDKYKKEEIGLKLICTTDGSLLNILSSSPLLKTPVINNNNVIEYTRNNLYEVVIVDEAHEHNKYMDLILTLMRNISYHNNDILTVIMSATLEDDEPIYRRFYRNINDNRKYPLDIHISIPYGTTGILDRINCDRRLDIRDPDSGTNYKIDEYYYPSEDPNTLAVKLLGINKSGYMLIFQPGKKEIDETVKFINNNTPNNIIALPYYSQLGIKNNTDNGVKEIIKNIDKLLKNIRVSKDEDINEISNISNGTNIYTRVVIVATNIAEASITIDNLEQVIDVGKQKISKFDRKIRDSILVLENITESSRLQRRGRVGRTKPGKVYYLYEKNTMKNNKIQYGISVSNIQDNLLDLIQNTSDELPFINIDVNNSSQMTQENLLKLKNGFDRILSSLYFINGKFYDYKGDNTQYDYENNDGCPLYNETGYRYTDIIDQNGKFYLIHPDELLITRNINGEITDIINNYPKDPDVIIKKNNDKLNTIKSKKIMLFFDNLMRMLMITFDGNKSIKTEIGKYIKKITTVLESDISINISQSLMLLYSYVFDCLEETITYLSMIKVINNDIKTLIPYDEKLRRFDKKIKGYIKEPSSDILTLINIGNSIEQYFTKIGTPLKHSEEKYLTAYTNYLHSMYDQNIEETISTIKNIMLNSDEYINNGYIDEIFNKYLIFVENEIINSIKNIGNFDKMGLSSQLIIDYCKSKLKLIGVIDKLNIKDRLNKNITLKELSIKLSPLKELISANTLNDKITSSLLLSNPYNIVKNIDNSINGYLNIFNPRLMSIKKIPSFYKYKYEPFCLMDNMYLKSYLYYDSYNPSKDEISICHRVNPKFLCLLSHVISLLELSEQKDTNYIKSEYKNKDDINIVNNYNRTFYQILKDLSSNRNNKIWNQLPRIDTSMREYSDIMKKHEIYGNSSISITI
jgi:hypothetical protein